VECRRAPLLRIMLERELKEKGVGGGHHDRFRIYMNQHHVDAYRVLFYIRAWNCLTYIPGDFRLREDES
jgi:hypothetical protein